ncbi:MAG: helix-turn-helix transcriptional regulator [Bacteroidota bacterium]
MEKLFRIFEITQERSNQILAPFYDAHIHQFEELIIVFQGSLEHDIDYQIETLAAPVACYLSSGKLHKLLPRTAMHAWVIHFKAELLPDSNLNYYSNFLTSNSIALQAGDNLKRFNSLCQLLQTETQQEHVDYTTIYHLLNGLITMIAAERKRNMPIENHIKSLQITIFSNFLIILEENFRLDVGVTFYANKLNITERNLNSICKNNVQKSVSEIIETRKLQEAKRMLLHTTKTISEIGYALGYNEKSYFTRVFHAKMNITPTRFRERTLSLFE